MALPCRQIAAAIVAAAFLKADQATVTGTSVEVRMAWL